MRASGRNRVVLAVALPLVLASCTATVEPERPDEVGGTLGEQAASFSVENVVVSFPDGAAPSAQVRVDAVPASAAPATLAPSASDGPQGPARARLLPLAAGVEVDLDDGQTQPARPVSVTFTLPTDQDGPAALAGGGNAALVVRSDDGSVDLVAAEYDAARGTVSGEVSHFSQVWPVALDLTGLVDTVLQSLNVASGRPDCEGRSATFEEVTYTVASQPQMWLCVAEDDGRLRVSATPNAATPFTITPSLDPERVMPGADMSFASALAVALTGVSDADARPLLVQEGSLVAFPGGTTSMVFDPDAGSFSLEVRSAPQLYLLQILSEVAGTLLDVSGAKLVRAIGTLECGVDVLETAFAWRSGALQPEFLAGFWRSFMSCAGEAAESLGVAFTGPVQVLFAIVATGPQLVIGGVLGAVTEAVGLGRSVATVQASYGEEVPVSGQVAGLLGTWSGPVDQPGSRPYSMQVTLRLTQGGKLRGSVVYPELSACRGYWDSPRFRGDQVLMVEHITQRADSCIPEGNVVLALSADGRTLDWTYAGDLASAPLTRGPLPETILGANRWPTDRDDAPPALWVWFGANGYAMPSWVSCDDTDQWCVAEQRDQVVVIRMRGLRVAGRLPVTVPDPEAALGSAGVPAASAAQIIDGR